MIGRDIVDRITPGMVEREPETIAAWIDKAVAEAVERGFLALPGNDAQCTCHPNAEHPEHSDYCIKSIRQKIRTLSPDPNFLERERLEARLEEASWWVGFICRHRAKLGGSMVDWDGLEKAFAEEIERRLREASREVKR